MTEQFISHNDEKVYEKPAEKQMNVYGNMTPELLSSIDSIAKDIDEKHEAGDTQTPSMDLRSGIAGLLGSSHYKGGYKLANSMNNHELKSFVDGARQELKQRKINELQSIVDTYDGNDSFADRRQALRSALEFNGDKKAFRTVYDMTNSDIRRFVDDARKNLADLAPSTHEGEIVSDNAGAGKHEAENDDRVTQIMKRIQEQAYKDLNIKERAAAVGVHGTYDRPFASYEPILTGEAAALPVEQETGEDVSEVAASDLVVREIAQDEGAIATPVKTDQENLVDKSHKQSEEIAATPEKRDNEPVLVDSGFSEKAKIGVEFLKDSNGKYIRDQDGEKVKRYFERPLELSQDCTLIDESNGIFGVFDGMGGMGGNPAAAARAARDAAHKFIINSSQPKTTDELHRMMRSAIAAGRDGVEREGEGGDTVGTLVKLARIKGEICLAVAHVGDTRLFAFDSATSSIGAVTDDQSDGNRVFNGFGKGNYRASDQYKVIQNFPVGTRLMICSDGITGDWGPGNTEGHPNQFLSLAEFLEAFRQKTPRQSADKFLAFSKKVDDKSVIVFDIKG